MEATKISVIVAIYNVEKEIHRCIDSIISQSFEDIEIILVNDGSPDKCPFICDEYGEKENRVRVIHKENGGLSDARNAGLLEALGEYVLFVDADDYLEKQACEMLYDAVEVGVDIVAGDAVKIEGEKKTPVNHCSLPPGVFLSGEEFLKKQLQAGNVITVALINLYNRKFLIENNLFFKKGIVYEDMQWTPRVFLKADKVKYVEYIFYNYMIRENSISQAGDKSKKAKDLLETCYELEEIFKELDDLELKKLLDDHIFRTFLSAIDLGNFYSGKFKDFYDKKFLLRKPISRRNKARSYLFLINKRAYKYIFMLYKQIQNALGKSTA